MVIEKAVMLMAGTMVLASTLLSVYHNPAWLYLTGFVGANLIFSALPSEICRRLATFFFKNFPRDVP